MRRVCRGYTIIEVTIVLAISGVLLSSAILMFRGQQGKTEFTQGMRDVDSKIQNLAQNVTASIPTSSQACSVNPEDPNSRPTLSSSTTASVGTNTDCIYLGNAIQAATGTDYLTIYPVLGMREADSFLYARPTPADSTNYPIIGGSTILSSKTYDFNNSSPQD